MCSAIFSCSKFEQDMAMNIQNKNNKVPFVPMKGKLLLDGGFRKTSNELIENLGMGYYSFSYPMASTNNTTYSIIDVNRIYEDPVLTSLIRIKNINESYSNYFSFTDFNEYSNHVIKNISTDIDLKGNVLWGLFKNQFKINFAYHNDNLEKESQKIIYGEVEVGVKTKSLSINTLNKNKLYSYLNPNFKHDYYFNTPDTVISVYGSEVLTDFIAGGKAFGVYKGETKDLLSKEEKTKKFDTYVKTSFGGFLKNIADIGADFNVKGDESATKEEHTEFSTFLMKFKTMGGDPGLGVTNFVGPGMPKVLNLDIKPWAQTIKLPEFAQIIAINQDGLMPIVSLMKEDNIKKSYESYLKKGRMIKIRRPSFYLDSSGHGVDVYIQSRFGDLIRVSRNKFPYSNSDPYTIVPAVVLPPRVGDFPIIFDSYFVSSPNEGMPIYHSPIKDFTIEFDDSLFDGISYPSYLKYDLSSFDKNDMYLFKIKNDISGVKYLHIRCNDKEYALAIFNTSVEKLYGLLIKDLPVKEIESDELDYLTIIAL